MRKGITIMTNREKYEVLRGIYNTLSGLFDCLYNEYDEEVNETMSEVESDIINLLVQYEADFVAEKENHCHRYSNCYILRDREDGEVIVKTYDDDKVDVMMRDVSKIICFSDCDDTFEVVKIVYKGREVEYAGWQPGMVMSYEYTVTGDEAWSGCFPQWNH